MNEKMAEEVKPMQERQEDEEQNLKSEVSEQEINKAMFSKREYFLKLHALVKEHGKSLVTLRSKSPIEFNDIYDEFKRILEAGGSENPDNDLKAWIKLAATEDSVEGFYHKITNRKQLVAGTDLHNAFGYLIAGLTAELATKKKDQEEK